jgi:AraC-like ligand binding domain
MRVTREPGQCHASTPVVSKVPGLRCWETRYAPNLDRPAHAHTNASINLVLQGSLIELCDGQFRTVTPGAVFFLPPDRSTRTASLARERAALRSDWSLAGCSAWRAARSRSTRRLTFPAVRSPGWLSGSVTKRGRRMRLHPS